MMIKKLREIPWPIYKIKLGSKNDLAIIRALRDETDALFRVDANAAWTADQCIAYAPILKELGVEFIEQPLPADDWLAMKKVKELSVLPLIADESCRTIDDLLQCAGSFHGINVKLSKAGGLTPAREMLLKAKEMGLKTMVGCMTESSVGISAVGQLLPYLDYVDMDGALLLAEDIAIGPEIVNGQVFLADRPGTGALLSHRIK
jgi:L-alanine-DL-glutamate epimerase-like enolase superfamily enzyme